MRDFILTAPSQGAPAKWLGAICERLIEEGVPLWRGASALHSLSPEVIAPHITWSRTEGPKTIVREHQIRMTPTWLGTPVEAIIEGDEPVIRCDLSDEAVLKRFPVLRELAQAGGRDYVIYRLDHSEALATTLDVFWRRQWISFTWDSVFTAEHLKLLESLLPAISCRLALETSKDAARSLLRAYLGPHASQRVLSGAFRRGTGEPIKAVIVFSDMRDFTRFSDSRPPAEVVASLDRYFDALASPMEELGGEVLKFIGDAMLAVFPLDQDACARALEAVKRARQNLASLPFKHGIALHAGEVLYGNIGARGRLDFTVIGGPVNEVCRVEALCKPLQREVLMTRAFVEAAGLRDAVSLGAQALKGVGAPIEVFALP